MVSDTIMSAYLRYFAKKFLKNNRKHRHTQTVRPIVSYTDDLISDYVILDGWFEHEILKFLGMSVFPNLHKRSTCLDIGAHIGNHSLYFSQYFEKVIAFEPHPITFEILKLNAASVDNITTMNVGCSNINCKKSAFEPAGNSGGTTVNTSSQYENSSMNLEFLLTPLDESKILNKVDSIDFIKVDVEGHEYECFHGAKNLLEQHSPVIACEILANSIINGTSPVIHLLDQFGYRYMYEIIDEGWGGVSHSKFIKAKYKLTSAIYGMITNKRKDRHFSLKLTAFLSYRDHRIVLFSKHPLT